MPEWLFDFLSGPTIKIAAAIWNSSMKLIIKLVCSTPQKFSTGTWAFVKENLYPWAEGIGLSALNLFFMIAFLKAVSNLHQNITLEMVIEAMIKVVVANVLYLNILNIMTTVFSISSAMAKEVFTLDAPDLKVEDMDIGSALFYQLFGLLFILAAIVCSFLMLWTVYSRYIKLYLLMILAPFAMSTLVGGQEIERSFYAWMRTFLLNAFEIVVIALTMVISFKLIGAGISLFDGKNIANLNENEAQQLKAKMDKFGIKVSSIGSPIGKIGIDDGFDEHLEMLKRVISTAKILGTKYIRVFSFYIPKDKDAAEFRDEVMRRMTEMTRLAEKEDVVLLHENEKGIYGDIAPRCADILKTVNSNNLRAVFDPANFIQCGQAVYPDGFSEMKPYIEYMHIKDAKEDGHVVPAGFGIGKIECILKDLKADGYHGFLSLEPHLGEFEGLSNLENGDMMKGLEKSDVGKFELAYQSLKNILERI